MAINFTHQVDNDILMVVTSGRDENLQEVLDYGMALLELVAEHNCKRLFCDERKLEYALSIGDTYELAEAAVQEAKSLKKIALVCHPDSLKDGSFYENVARNRGLVVFVTADYDEGLRWVKE